MAKQTRIPSGAKEDIGCCGTNANVVASSLGAEETITEAVRARYGAPAVEVLSGGQNPGCCDTDCCVEAAGDVISQGLYAATELEGLPLKAALASLGCGNPTALAELREGEIVLDLGSGGIDVLLSAQRVGPSGFAYGVDMTDPMLELARHNAEEAGVLDADSAADCIRVVLRHLRQSRLLRLR